MFGRSRLLVVTALVSLGACSSALAFQGVTLDVDREANDRSPVPTELVVVVDRALTERLAALNAEEWFRQRDQLRNDFPNGFRTVYWELVPGQRIVADPVPVGRSGAVAVFLFARYGSEGSHRLRLDPVRVADIHLTEDGPVLRNPGP